MAEVTLKEVESNKMEVDEVNEGTIVEKSKDKEEIDKEKEDFCKCNCIGNCIYKDCEDIRK